MTDPGRDPGSDPPPDAVPGAPDPLDRLRHDLREAGCEALLVLTRSAKDPDLAPFVGPVHIHAGFLVVPAKGEPWLGYLSPMERDEAAKTGFRLLPPDVLGVARWAKEGVGEEELLAEVIAQGMALAGVLPGRVALGGHPAAGVLWAVSRRLEKEGWNPTSGRDLLRLFRKTKSAAQLRAVRHAADGTVAAMRRVADVLAGTVIRDHELWFEGERLRVGRLRREIALTLAGFGLEQPEGNIVAPGAAGGVPHSAGEDETILRPHQSLVVDLYPRGEMFADCTRTFCVGEPPEALKAAHAAVVEALERAHASCRPGKRAWELQVECCDFLKGKGYPTPVHDPGTTEGYVHGLGHGVGFELHELPSFREVAGREGVLEVGDVLTLEPGVYFAEGVGGGEGFGVRVEDLVVVVEGGVECLTPSPLGH